MQAEENFDVSGAERIHQFALIRIERLTTRYVVFHQPRNLAGGLIVKIRIRTAKFRHQPSQQGFLPFCVGFGLFVLQHGDLTLCILVEEARLSTHMVKRMAKAMLQMKGVTG